MTFVNTVNGNTYFDGSGRDSFFSAGAGDDFLVGGGGDDYLMGGDGNDFIIGGGFNDGEIFHIDWFGDGLVGLPVLPDDTSFDGSDTLIGGAGDDTIIGIGWNDGLVDDNGLFDFGEAEGPEFVIALVGAEPENLIWAGSGNDLVVGGHFDDTIDDFNIIEDALVFTHINDIRNYDDLLFYSFETVIDGQFGVLIETTETDSIFLAGLNEDDLFAADVIF